ncbi:hypothetical protein HU200_061653 [Digitaria exilis]|uniref:F-box domain-containing protein n=1 Tax=Digitaria exilis TaxID=1010633 RepID=A0A835AA48_9POAL|nr:hypothetical protein HU200_061653 [Digitaria exilis]
MADSPPHRKPRTEGEAATVAAPDLLSQLPIEVLDKILSRLHIYDVVRTSVLSRAWRRRWETLPTVNICRSPPIPADELDVILLRRTAPPRNFRLLACGHCLFSCHELTSLDLTSCRLPHTPAGFAGFPNLKRLKFDKVTIPDHGGKQLAALIARSPSIERVELTRVELIGDDPEAEDEWAIQAPNLRELTIASRFPYGGRVEDLPRLRKGVLVGCNYAKFLMGMAQITKLEFACGVDWFAEVDVLDRLPFLFENLRSLVITVDFTEMFAILAFFCLLRSAPGWNDGPEVFNADYNFLNAQWVDGMFAKLHVVRMKNILCFPNEMHFVEFILSKAMVLQVLSVRLGPDSLCGIEEAAVTIKEYTKASPDAQVIFLGSESTNAGPINVSTEKADTGEVQTTGREHHSIDTPAEMERQTEDGKCASISASTENDEAEETQTTFTGCASIYKSMENAKVDETQTTSSEHECINTFTENAEVEETQTSGSGLVNDVRPQRRHRLDLDSVAQLEQLEVDMRELQEDIRLQLDFRRLALERRTSVLGSVIKSLNYQSYFKATSRTGDFPVNLDVNGSASIRVDSSEDHGVNGADNAHPDPREDDDINGASMAQGDS